MLFAPGSSQTRVLIVLRKPRDWLVLSATSSWCSCSGAWSQGWATLHDLESFTELALRGFFDDAWLG